VKFQDPPGHGAVHAAVEAVHGRLAQHRDVHVAAGIDRDALRLARIEQRAAVDQAPRQVEHAAVGEPLSDAPARARRTRNGVLPVDQQQVAGGIHRHGPDGGRALRGRETRHRDNDADGVHPVEAAAVRDEDGVRICDRHRGQALEQAGTGCDGAPGQRDHQAIRPDLADREGVGQVHGAICGGGHRVDGDESRAIARAVVRRGHDGDRVGIRQIARDE
jgi:hypothetical protein